MIKKHPSNIDLASVLSYKLPLPGVLSIIHRITGIILFFALPIVLWLLQYSLESAESFAHLQECMDSFLVKLVLWGIVSGLLYHLVAGIKHLLMDVGIGESLEGVDKASKITIVVSGVLIVLAGGLIR